jgi:hypothetical protein
MPPSPSSFASTARLCHTIHFARQLPALRYLPPVTIRALRKEETWADLEYGQIMPPVSEHIGSGREGDRRPVRSSIALVEPDR